MKAIIFNQQRDLPLSPCEIEELVSFVLKRLKASCDEVVLHFVTKRKIGEIHKIYFNDPSPTDCISFPIDSPSPKVKGYKVLGEVFVCPKVAMEYAAEHRLDPTEELYRYVIHGLLHLVGYDDLEETQQKRMRRMENLLLKLSKDACSLNC